MHMTLPAWTYLVVGVLVTWVSSSIDNFEIFLAIGFIFIFIGMIKLIGTFGLKKLIIRPDTRELKNYKKCKACGAYNYPYVDKCHYCGNGI